MPTPKVHLNGQSCKTGDANIDFAEPKNYTDCTGLEVTANTSSTWFNEANLAYQIGDFDSKETVKVTGGRITKKGSLNSVTIAADGKSAKSASTGCSGGNPNTNESCSILAVFNYGYQLADGGNFKIDLNNEWNGAGKTGSSGHEFKYDGPSYAGYRTLTFDPNGGSVVDDKVQSDGTIGDESTLWSHPFGANVLREYKYGSTANEYPTPTRAGYTLVPGWYDAVSGGNRVSALTMNSDSTLYAHWTPVATAWYISGRTAITSPWTIGAGDMVIPGQSVTFHHYVRNSGPDATTSNILADTVVSGGLGMTKTAHSLGKLTVMEVSSDTDTISIPLNAANGKKYCQRVGYRAKAYNDGTRGEGAEKCVTVQYGYELTPHVNRDVPTVRAGGDVTFKPNVTDSNSYPTNDTSWSIRRVIIPPALSVPYTGVRTTGNFDCPYYTSKGMSCTDVESGSSVFTGTGPTYLATINGYTYNVANNVPFGTQICYALTINSRDDTPSKRAEALTCVIVSKSPLLQVWGNDVRVGSALLTVNNTSGSLIKTNSGSWGEYGVLAPGKITTFGSASNKSGSQLTFANTPSGTLGRYLSGGSQASSLGGIPDIGRYLVEAGNATNKGRTGVSIVNGTTSVSGYDGNRVIRTSGTVTITGDIKNNSSGSNLTQMVIIADNININPNVTQVDAWLIAPGGSINTCVMAVEQRLTATTCDKQLRINGPITASSLVLRRTYGGDGTEPAEILNLRGDAYMWMRHISEQMGTIHTTYLRELPPRY